MRGFVCVFHFFRWKKKGETLNLIIPPPPPEAPLVGGGTEPLVRRSRHKRGTGSSTHKKQLEGCAVITGYICRAVRTTSLGAERVVSHLLFLERKKKLISPRYYYTVIDCVSCCSAASVQVSRFQIKILFFMRER